MWGGQKTEFWKVRTCDSFFSENVAHMPVLYSCCFYFRNRWEHHEYWLKTNWSLTSRVAVLEVRSLSSFNCMKSQKHAVLFLLVLSLGHTDICLSMCVCVCVRVWVYVWTIHPSVNSRLLTVILIPLQISRYWPSISLYSSSLAAFFIHVFLSPQRCRCQRLSALQWN